MSLKSSLMGVWTLCSCLAWCEDGPRYVLASAHAHGLTVADYTKDAFTVKFDHTVEWSTGDGKWVGGFRETPLNRGMYRLRHKQYPEPCMYLTNVVSGETQRRCLDPAYARLLVSAGVYFSNDLRNMIIAPVLVSKEDSEGEAELSMEIYFVSFDENSQARAPRKLMTVTPRKPFWAPTWSRDGRQFCFGVGDSVYVGATDPLEMRRVGEGERPAMSQDGHLIAIKASSEAGLIIDLAGQSRFQLGQTAMRSMLWHPDGRTLLYVVIEPGEHVLKAFDVERGTSSEVARSSSGLGFDPIRVVELGPFLKGLVRKIRG